MASQDSVSHTPTPWIGTFSGFLNGAQYVTGLTDKSGHEWARIVQSPLGKGGDELEANSAFIVRAVNNHESLVKALMDTARVLENLESVLGTAFHHIPSLDHSMNEMLNLARVSADLRHQANSGVILAATKASQ